jgi:hypothetical protein
MVDSVTRRADDRVLLDAGRRGGPPEDKEGFMWRWAVVVASILAVGGGAGCDSAGAAAGDAGADALACACGAGEFCCLGACLPLGSTCGGAADAGPDAPPLHDGAGTDAAPRDAGPPTCSPRPAPDAGVVEVAARCLDGHTLWRCSPGVAQPCSTGTPDCQEWYDPGSHTWTAGCLDSGKLACDPHVDHHHCDGAFIAYCNVNINYPGSGPPGLAIRSDCRTRWGADATCVMQDGGVPGCASATAVPCDPGSFSIRCTADLAGRQECASDILIVETTACPAGQRCLDNASTRASSAGVACIPASAVPSTAPATTQPATLACVGANTVRLEQYGYEWTQQCPTEPVHNPDGTWTWVAQVCYAATGAPRCEPPGTEHCDPLTFVASCSTDGHHQRSCTGDEVVTESCGIFSEPGVCDPSSGRCVPLDSCNPGWPFQQECVVNNTYRMVCDQTTGVAVPQPCANCRPDPSDSTRMLCG